MCYVLFAFYHVHDFYLSCNLQRKSDLCHNPSSSPGIYSDAVFHCSIACLDLVVIEFLFFLLFFFLLFFFFWLPLLSSVTPIILLTWVTSPIATPAPAR